MTSSSIRGSTSIHLGPKEQERLEAGLRILARIIASAYKRRGEAEVQGAQTTSNAEISNEARK